MHGTPAAGFAAFGGGLLYDTLMEQATDEASASHPLIADAYKYPDDYSSATYRLDPRAKWHDGKPITVDDVIWSFKVLKANSPHVQPLLTTTSPRRWRSPTARSSSVSTRRAIANCRKIIGDLVVLPKHWWEGTDANGKKRDITKPTLEPPLGSGRLQDRQLQARFGNRLGARARLLGAPSCR